MTSSNKPRLIDFVFSLVLPLFVSLATMWEPKFAFASSQPYLPSHGINYAVGNKYLSEIDLSLNGPGNSISFKRSYNSSSNEDGILGYGWTASFCDHLRIEEKRIILIEATGQHVTFTGNGDGTWSSKTGKLRKITVNSAGYTLNEPNGTARLFSVSGKLKEIKWKKNEAITLTYQNDRVSTINDSFGRTLTFAYNDQNLLESLSSPIGLFTYQYNENGDLIVVHRPDNSIRKYLHDDQNDIHKITGVINEEGQNIITVSYDEKGRVISSALTGNSEALTIEYLDDLKRKITDSRGVSTVYQLEIKSGRVRVASFTGPGCSTCGASIASEYSYNDRFQIAKSTNANNNLTLYEYDERGNRTTKTEGVDTDDERVTRWTYDPATNKVKTIVKDSVSNPEGQYITSMEYDENGNLLSRTENGFSGSTPITRTTGYTYDGYGRITSINGPRTDVDDVTTITYYPNEPDQGLNRGFLHTVTNALGHTTTYEKYNAFGQPERVITPSGIVTTTYDLMGRLKTSTREGITVTNIYDLTGKFTRREMPGGRFVTYDYNPAGQLKAISDALGNSITYSYDSTGKRTREEVRDPAGELRRFMKFTYEDNGKLDKTILADGTFE
ncbi:MAG: DUF6531 domain-containing protein, partial [Desulfobulbaceae bacterium]|nr:DUF6531 domain-containing protein [Desulfobulbaceae bacterium]